VPNAEHNLVGGQARQMSDEARNRGPVAESLDDLRSIRALVDPRHDVGRLHGAPERARQHTIDDHSAPAQRLDHSPVIAPPAVGERSVTIVGPSVTIWMAGIGMSHQEQSHHPE
jgi:hypothetical protein